MAHVQAAHHVQAAQPVLAQVRAALHVQAVLLVQAALHVQPVLDSVAHVQAVHQDLVLQALAPQAVVQAQVAVAVAVLVPQVHLERVALRTRAASPSALREKNLNKDQHRASVVQLFHAETAALLFAFVADPQFRTSQTRLALTQVS